MKRFAIDRFVKKAKCLDLVDVIIFTHDEACKARLYLEWHKDHDYYRKHILAYYDFTQKALRFFEQGGQPQDIESNLCQQLKPVIEALIRKGQLHQTISS